MGLEFTIETANKCFAADDAAVGEISGSISKSVHIIQLKILLPFLVNTYNLSSLINKLPVIFQPILFIFHTNLPQTEIKREKTVSIIGLSMVPQRTLEILFGAFDHSRSDRVQVDVSKAANQNNNKLPVSFSTGMISAPKSLSRLALNGPTQQNLNVIKFIPVIGFSFRY